MHYGEGRDDTTLRDGVFREHRSASTRYDRRRPGWDTGRALVEGSFEGTTARISGRLMDLPRPDQLERHDRSFP